MPQRILIIFAFLFTLVLMSIRLKESAVRIQEAGSEMNVEVVVVELPICGRSNLITVEYEHKKYDISVNKNDCIEGKYHIGDLIAARYYPALDEMNPLNFVGAYRANLAFLIFVSVCFLLFLFRRKVFS